MVGEFYLTKNGWFQTFKEALNPSCQLINLRLFTVDIALIPATMLFTNLLISNDRIKMENPQNISLTPEAAIAIKTLQKEQNLSEHSLRIFIAGVG